MRQKLRLIQATKTLLLLSIVLVLLPILTAAQDTPAVSKPSENGAKIIQQTPSVKTDGDDPLAQMLQQSIAEARAWKLAAQAALEEIKKKDRLLELDELEIKKLHRIIEVSDKLIKRLERQCTSYTIFFVIKIKKC